MSKTSKHRSNDSKGIRDNSCQNSTFMKLKLVCPNNISNSTNSEDELLCGEVGETQMSFVK
jgi:hypothetical protein